MSSSIKYNIPITSSGSSTYVDKTYVTGLTGFIASTETGSVRAIKSNVTIYGNGTITLTSGSTAVVGHGTNFTDATTGLGLSYWFQILVVDSNNNLFRLSLASIQNATGATMSICYKENDIANATLTTSGANFIGASGTYSYKIIDNYAKDLYSIAFGNNAYAKNFGFAFGGSVSATGQTSFALGRFTQAGGAQSVAMGSIGRAGGAQAFAGGLGSVSGGDKKLLANGAQSFIFSLNNSSQTVGHGALAASAVILGGLNHNIPSNSTRSVIIGGNTIKALSAVTDMVYMPKVSVGLGTGGALTTANANQNVVARNSTTGALEITNGAGVLTGNTVDIKVNTVGKGFYVKEGANATMGLATLVAGSVVVSTTKVTATSRIQLTGQADGGTPGFVRVSTRSAGTSFTITSSSGTDTSTVGWIIIEPA